MCVVILIGTSYFSEILVRIKSRQHQEAGLGELAAASDSGGGAEVLGGAEIPRQPGSLPQLSGSVHTLVGCNRVRDLGCNHARWQSEMPGHVCIVGCNREFVGCNRELHTRPGISPGTLLVGEFSKI
jgi:hypothetical protein